MMSEKETRLTKLVAAAGWAAKIGPGVLSKLLSDLNPYLDENVLISGSTFDDAGIYKINEQQALVQTVDFFTPMVDDPYMFGEIAVANALSDVYAMGGTPITAMNIVGFPINCLDKEILKEILKGGSDKLREANVSLLGGHTVDDKEPKYGVSVTGLIDPNQLWANNGIEEGDIIILTKKLGTGVISTAIKRDIALENEIIEVSNSMRKLNKLSSEIGRQYSINGCTDITGFGLVGHLKEMVGDKDLTIVVHSDKLPLLEGTLKHINNDVYPGGTTRNLEYMKDYVDFSCNQNMKKIVGTPETSGGLIFSLPAKEGHKLVEQLQKQGEIGAIIGEVVPFQNKKVKVV